MKEAAQKALDAFKTIRACTVNVWDVDEEIKALEEALAKQEQGGWHTHDLYTDADKNRPDVICDSNGQVTLGLCKRCGRGEAELETPCDKAKQEQGEPVAWVDDGGQLFWKDKPLPDGTDFYVQQQPAQHWHDLYKAKCQELHDERARLGAQIEALEHQPAQQRKPVPPSAYESLVHDMTTIAAREVPRGVPIAEFAMHALADAELRQHDAPQQRTWVGLTEQEAAECWSTSTVRTWKAIEAKLKEKNAK